MYPHVDIHRYFPQYFLNYDFFAACLHGRLGEARSLLKKGADINFKGAVTNYEHDGCVTRTCSKACVCAFYAVLRVVR